MILLIIPDYLMNINPIRKQRSFELMQMRLEAKITRNKLSTISGLHLATIYRIESGDIGWNVDSEFIYFLTLKNYIENKSLK